MMLNGAGVTGLDGFVGVYGPRVGLTPDGGAPGAPTTLQGGGFVPGAAVAVGWGSGSGTSVTAQADATGALTVGLTAPVTLTQGDNVVTTQDLSATYPVTTAYAGGGLVWNSTLTSLPTFRRRPAVALAQDGTLYVVGGSTNTSALYHPSTDSWSIGPTLPYSVEGGQGLTLPDGRIAVLGGSSTCSFTNNCTIYNTVSVYTPTAGGSQWSTTAIPPMQLPRYRFAAVLAGTQIYAIGGWVGNGNTNTVEMYDLATPSAGWQSVAPLPAPQPLESLGAAVGPDGRIYVVGGLTGFPDDRGGQIVNTVYIYDPAHPAQGWLTGPRLPWSTEDTAITQVNATLGPDGQIYVIGGWDGYPGRFDLHGGAQAAVTALNPRTLSWVRATSLPNAVTGRQAVATLNGQLYVVGDAQLVIGTVTEGLGGSLPWHPHQTTRLSEGLNATVDLADGHLDVSADGLSLPGRGPDLQLTSTWDSLAAAAAIRPPPAPGGRASSRPVWAGC